MSERGSDILAKARRWREVESISHESVQNVAELLDKVAKFLQEHETPSANDCTHTVFDDYIDWWMNQKPSFKLAIAEDNALETLYTYCTQMYTLGIPLTLAEKRSPEIGFVQDIEIWGTKETTILAEDILHPQKKFTRLLGQTMGEIYPGHQFLNVVAFDSTGISKTKGVMKTSIRLVWCSITVDKDRAARICDFFVHKFKESKEEEIRAIGEKLTEFNKDNQWATVFNNAIYLGPFGIRMPLCDRVSPAPLKKPEQRPLKPVGVFRFNYNEGEVDTVESFCEQDGLDGVNWLKIGCVRRDAGTPLTEWNSPQWKGEHAPGICIPFTSLQNRNPDGAVKIRTKCGSDDGRGERRSDGPRDPVRVVRVVRAFDGTSVEFKQKLQEQLGAHEGHSIKLDDEGVSWKQGDGDGGRIHFKASNNRVYVSGKPHQVRSLLNAIATFSREINENALSATSHGGSAAHSKGGAGSASSSYAPSAAYAPSAVYAPSVAYAASTASGRGTRREGDAVAEPTKRIVIRAFEAESSGELKLSVDDHVTIEHDPDRGQHNIHRWVYGPSETSQERGWFPLSHTAQLQTQDTLLQET